MCHSLCIQLPPTRSYILIVSFVFTSTILWFVCNYMRKEGSAHSEYGSKETIVIGLRFPGIDQSVSNRPLPSRCMLALQKSSCCCPWQLRHTKVRTCPISHLHFKYHDSRSASKKTCKVVKHTYTLCILAPGLYLIWTFENYTGILSKGVPPAHAYLPVIRFCDCLLIAAFTLFLTQSQLATNTRRTTTSWRPPGDPGHKCKRPAIECVLLSGWLCVVGDFWGYFLDFFAVCCISVGNSLLTSVCT